MDRPVCVDSARSTFVPAPRDPASISWMIEWLIPRAFAAWVTTPPNSSADLPHESADLLVLLVGRDFVDTTKSSVAGRRETFATEKT